jgi:hypothetical protein
VGGPSKPVELATRSFDKQGDATSFFKAMLNRCRPAARVSNDNGLNVAAFAPTRKDISNEYLQNFDGMTEEAVSRDELIIAREAVIVSAVEDVPDGHRQFLAGFERCEPDGSLLGIAAATDLPTVKWRQQNLDRIDKDKREKLVWRLEEGLFGNEA